MRYTVFTMVALLVNAHLYAQVKGIILDAETLAPLSDAIIYYKGDGTKTDKDGKFQLNAKDGSFKVSLLGYDAEDVKLQTAKPYYKVLLTKQYTDLTAVEIKTKRLTVEDIMNKAIDSIKVNYVDGGKILAGEHRMVLIEGADTVADISMPVYYKGKKNKWLHQKRYKRKQGRFTKIVFTDSSKNELKDYGEDLNILFDDLKKSFKGLARHNGSRTFLSTFLVGDQTYYDIIFISIDSSRVGYDVRTRAMGYGTKNNPNARKKYMNITEVHVNAANFAVEYEQILSIAGSDKEVDVFLALNDRSALANWTKDVNSTGRKFRKASAGFTYNNDGKLYLSSEYFFDNLIHMLYKNKENPIRDDVSFISTYSLKEYKDEMPEDKEWYVPRIELLYGID